MKAEGRGKGGFSETERRSPKRRGETLFRRLRALPPGGIMGEEKCRADARTDRRYFLHMPEMKEIISSRRKERNMTQEQLAEKIGVSAKVVSKWETGRSLPDTSFLLPLCDALGLTVQELLRAEEGVKSSLPARPRGNFFTAEIVGAAAFVFAALLFLCGWFIRQGDYWNRKETLCVVLYILAAFFLIGGTAAYLILRARAAEKSALAEDKRCARRDILFVFAGLVVCIAAMFVGALGDFSPRERKDFALIALIILAALTALLVGALVWNRKRK